MISERDPVFDLETVDKIWMDISYISCPFIKFPYDVFFDPCQWITYENTHFNKKNIISVVNRLSKRFSKYNFSDIEKDYNKEEVDVPIKKQFPAGVKIMFAAEYNHNLVDLIDKKSLFFFQKYHFFL